VFEVISIKKLKSVTVKDTLTSDIYTVDEAALTQGVEVGAQFGNRIAKFEDKFIFIGTDPILLNVAYAKTTLLKSLKGNIPDPKWYLEFHIEQIAKLAPSDLDASNVQWVDLSEQKIHLDLLLRKYGISQT
jgi:hypothetical protein